MNLNSQTTLTPSSCNRSMLVLGLLSSSMFLGCASKEKEREPRPNIRPMINAIEQAQQDWNWITAQQWILNEIESIPVLDGSSITLEFKEHTWLIGSSGCNQYTAGYDRKAESGLNIQEIMSTRMYCSDPIGIDQQEARYLKLLKAVDSYSAQPDRLTLYTEDEPVLIFELADDSNLAEE